VFNIWHAALELSDTIAVLLLCCCSAVSFCVTAHAGNACCCQFGRFLLRLVVPQVRYAACVATRTFMKCVGQEEQHRFLPTLTGPMCLNRSGAGELFSIHCSTPWLVGNPALVV
jgi:hypothetical protein